MYYANWLSFEEWCQRGGQARASFWATLDHVNLGRARNARWVLGKRHWPEHYLVECLADLSDQLPAQRRKRRKRTTHK
jgi:hypothetical protein